MAGPKERKKLNKDLVTYDGKRMHWSTAEGLAMDRNVSFGEGDAANFRSYVYQKGHYLEDLSASQRSKLYEQYLQEKNRKFMD
tara:strand:+ start:216 stop:464 length:249 start_codon:yes stop_codon:yes gene_type:complete